MRYDPTYQVAHEAVRGSLMDLPAHLQPFESLLPPQPGPERTDALLALSEGPHPLQEQVALAVQARTLAGSLNDPGRVALAELRLAQLLPGDEGLGYAQSAAGRFERLRDLPHELSALEREAQLTAEPAERLPVLLRAASLATEAQLPVRERDLQIAAGLLLRTLGDNTRALEAFTRALALAESTETRVAALEALLGLGELHLEAQRPDEALAPLRTAGHMTHGEGTAAQARALGGLGRIYAAQGDHTRAARFLESAAQLAEAHGTPDLQAQLLTALAAAREATGAPDAARTLLRRSLALTEHSHPAQHGETLLALGAYALRQGQLAEARDGYACAAQYGQEHGLPAVVSRALRERAQLAEMQGDLPGAMALLREWGEALPAALRAAQQQAQQVDLGVQTAREALALRRERQEVYESMSAALEDTSTRLNAMQIMLQRSREVAMTDPDSGAHSLAFGTAVLDLHYSRSVRQRSPLTVAIVGVEVSTGHTEGPTALLLSNVISAVARLLESSVRDMDTVARFDRFKFLVVFPETPPAGAQIALHRLIDRVRTYEWGVGGMSEAVTVGAGLVGRGSVQGTQPLIAAADAEYYRARREGPNTISTAQ
ncbi:tetratricopeptide repeat protein [Deinococcus taeanensis]|uniref:tetratricopeptide repeat protein n=1 Tax=Deinococcus taeanensis TaxID=2737050 RepID=UPI001CDCDCFC|nr:tetratricopeptide repeat protein [Deinococcus taeanensis]UBV42985.1 tetratricopeptide repeat protein [Deinococcus taeanensis]